MRTNYPALDDIDQQIVTLLTQDARLSVARIAETVHVSRAHAYQRLERLKERNIITGYTAKVGAVAAGLTSSAYVTLKLRQHSWRELKTHLASIPGVHHIALVGGSFDVILLVRAATNESLRSLVFDHLQSIPEVLDTHTHIIFEDQETA